MIFQFESPESSGSKFVSLKRLNAEHLLRILNFINKKKIVVSIEYYGRFFFLLFDHNHIAEINMNERQFYRIKN